MSKEKINKIFFIILMVLSLILITNDFIEVAKGSKYEIWNITHIGLFVFAVYLFYLGRKNERKMEESSQKSAGSNGKVLDINMLEVKEKVDLKKGMQTLWIIWALMIGSLAIYVVACYVTGDKIKINLEIYSFSLFKNILYIVVAVELVVAHYMRKFLLRVRSGKIAKESDGSIYRSALNKYTTALVSSLAIADSIGIYGVVLFFMSKDFQSLYIFVTISAIAMFIYRPKREGVEKLAMNLKG
ncbi:MAG: hypothetical protein HY755_05325 [Nitrospirae bacterium]|nr:hypothetical protein [Nitrospirota bacterium]